MQMNSSVMPSAEEMPNSGGAFWVAAWISVVNTSMRAGRPISRGTSYDDMPSMNSSNVVERIAGRSSGSVIFGITCQ